MAKKVMSPTERYEEMEQVLTEGEWTVNRIENNITFWNDPRGTLAPPKKVLVGQLPAKDGGMTPLYQMHGELLPHAYPTEEAYHMQVQRNKEAHDKAKRK